MVECKAKFEYIKIVRDEFMVIQLGQKSFKVH